LATLVSVQPIETVIAVLAASRDGASINAAAKACRLPQRTSSGSSWRLADARIQCAGKLVTS
jgi:hypothetical protein